MNLHYCATCISLLLEQFSLAILLLKTPLSVKQNKPNPNPNPTPTPHALLIPWAAEPSVRRSTPEGAVEAPRPIPNKTANADFQFSTSTRDGPLTKVQILSSRIYELEKLFSDEIETYTSITVGIHFQYFFIR